jgi:hypothetical protein
MGCVEWSMKDLIDERIKFFELFNKTDETWIPFGNTLDSEHSTHYKNVLIVCYLSIYLFYL